MPATGTGKIFAHGPIDGLPGAPFVLLVESPAIFVEIPCQYPSKFRTSIFKTVFRLGIPSQWERMGRKKPSGNQLHLLIFPAKKPPWLVRGFPSKLHLRTLEGILFNTLFSISILSTVIKDLPLLTIIVSVIIQG